MRLRDVRPSVGDRVRIVASWSCFFGRTGRIVDVCPLMVHLDADPYRPMRFGPSEIELTAGAE